MVRDDVTRFAATIAGLAEIFSSKVSSVGVDMMFRALNEYSIEEIEDAAIELTRTRKYTKMPTPADFIEIIDGSVEDRAMEVAYGGGDADDPIAEEVRRALDCDYPPRTMLESDLPRYRASFIKLYAAKSREVKRQERKMLVDYKQQEALNKPDVPKLTEGIDHAE